VRRQGSHRRGRPRVSRWEGARGCRRARRSSEARTPHQRTRPSWRTPSSRRPRQPRAPRAGAKNRRATTSTAGAHRRRARIRHGDATPDRWRAAAAPRLRLRSRLPDSARSPSSFERKSRMRRTAGPPPPETAARCAVFRLAARRPRPSGARCCHPSKPPRRAHAVNFLTRPNLVTTFSPIGTVYPTAYVPPIRLNRLRARHGCRNGLARLARRAGRGSPYSPRP
jgi:hypothetical protein